MFHYLFGVREPSFYGVLLTDNTSLLFYPTYTETDEIFNGPNLTPSEVILRYGVTNAYPISELSQTLINLNPAKLYMLGGNDPNSDIPYPQFTIPGLENTPIERETLTQTLHTCRSLKTPLEQDLLSQTITNMVYVTKCAMKSCHPGMTELQLEGIMKYISITQYLMRYDSFTSIVGSGVNSSILHYGHAGRPNDKVMRDGELVLIDAGWRGHHYCADVSFTFPVGGVFSDQKGVIMSF